VVESASSPHLQAHPLVLNVLCIDGLIASKGHAQHTHPSRQPLIGGVHAAMAQEHLDSGVGQHSRLWRPGHQHQVLGQGRGALQVGMLSLGFIGC
jgi:hypothetical protein